MGQEGSSLAVATQLYQLPQHDYALKKRLNAALALWQNKYPPFQDLLEYRLILNTEEELKEVFEGFKMRHEHQLLPSSHYITYEQQGVKGCGEYYRGSLFFENALTTLSKINDIPFEDSLHMYQVALKGFHILYKTFGYFDVFEDMFHINQSGKLKVWCNALTYKPAPESYLQDQSGREGDMISRIVHIINENIDSSEDNNFRRALQRKVAEGYKLMSFEEANQLFRMICRENGWQPPERLRCLQNFSKEDLHHIMQVHAQSEGLIYEDKPDTTMGGYRLKQRVPSKQSQTRRKSTPATNMLSQHQNEIKTRANILSPSLQIIDSQPIIQSGVYNPRIPAEEQSRPNMFFSPTNRNNESHRPPLPPLLPPQIRHIHNQGSIYTRNQGSPAKNMHQVQFMGNIQPPRIIEQRPTLHLSRPSISPPANSEWRYTQQKSFIPKPSQQQINQYTRIPNPLNIISPPQQRPPLGYSPSRTNDQSNNNRNLSPAPYRTLIKADPALPTQQTQHISSPSIRLFIPKPPDNKPFSNNGYSVPNVDVVSPHKMLMQEISSDRLKGQDQYNLHTRAISNSRRMSQSQKSMRYSKILQSSKGEPPQTTKPQQTNPPIYIHTAKRPAPEQTTFKYEPSADTLYSKQTDNYKYERQRQDRRSPRMAFNPFDYLVDQREKANGEYTDPRLMEMLSSTHTGIAKDSVFVSEKMNFSFSNTEHREQTQHVDFQVRSSQDSGGNLLQRSKSSLSYNRHGMDQDIWADMVQLKNNKPSL